MWTVVYIASNTRITELIKSALSDEGFMVNIKQRGATNKKTCFYEILVPASEAEEATEIINHVISN